MPLPWKKSKVSAISRIVADLQSPKHGNSLVVQTGFPTSLVDLFCKNRDRLKKPSSKRKKKHQQQQHQQQQRVVDEIVIGDPVPGDSEVKSGFVPPPPPSPGGLAEQQGMTTVEASKLACEVAGRNLDFDSDQAVVVESSVVRGGGGLIEKERRVLVAVLKTFVVVVLALSAKKLAVGITLSAFALILLDYVGKHLSCFFEPCSKSAQVLQPLIRTASSSFVAQKHVLIPKGVKGCEKSEEEVVVREGGGDAGLSDSCDLVDTIEFSSRIEEIRAVESNYDMTQRVEGKLALREAEEDRASEKGQCQKDKTRKKIIKKLLPKKLRHGKKGKSRGEKEPETSIERPSGCREDKLGRIEELKEQGNGGKLLYHCKGKLLISEVLQEEEKEECEGETEKDRREGKQKFNHEDSSLSSELQSESDIVVVEEQREIERKGNSSYLVLFLAVLVGLVGGRILALVLTIASCLILILFGRPKRPVNGKSMKGSSASASVSRYGLGWF